MGAFGTRAASGGWAELALGPASGGWAELAGSFGGRAFGAKAAFGGGEVTRRAKRAGPCLSPAAHRAQLRRGPSRSLGAALGGWAELALGTASGGWAELAGSFGGRAFGAKAACGGGEVDGPRESGRPVLVSLRLTGRNCAKALRALSGPPSGGGPNSRFGPASGGWAELAGSFGGRAFGAKARLGREGPPMTPIRVKRPTASWLIAHMLSVRRIGVLARPDNCLRCARRPGQVASAASGVQP
jgi:hypothetical protein